MTIEDTKRTVEEFIKYLQIPNSPYELGESDNSDSVEMQISKDDKLVSAVTVSNGTVSILYNGDYDENKFFKHNFQSPIYLLYILSIVYYSTVCDNIGISYDDLMTIVLGEEITNWKDLAVTLAKKVMLNAEADMDDVLIEDKKLSYQDFSGKITYGTIEYQIEPHSYTQLIESIYLIIEYVAILHDTQDSLFTDAAENNLIEEEQPEEEEEPPMSMGGGMGMDLGGEDFGDMGAPEPVTPEEAEENPVDMDFSMPDGLDQEGMDDLLAAPEGEE